jgi:hypothetical protein
MRLAFIATVLAALAGSTALDTRMFSQAAAEECTGENCTPKDGPNSGRDCESKKKEQTIS